MPPRRSSGRARAARVVRVVLLAGATSTAAMRCDAALYVVGTRFVYPGDAHAMTMLARNGGEAPILVQAWLDDGDANADPSHLRVPFVVTPPLARVEPAQSLSIRVQAVGALAPDRESRFWINLLEVPPAARAGDHTLRIAYRLRMKVLYRPAGLAGEADDAPNRLAWTRAGGSATAPVTAINPTPYYVTLTRLLLNGEPVALANGSVEVAPFDRVDVPIGADADTHAGDITFDAVDDNGASHEYRAALAPPRTSLAVPVLPGQSAGIQPQQGKMK
ncbi:fimbria/pilus periplasmic chaperone [Burkholderia sp. BCC0801]|uniref:fimbrial biogenesis chaperone n=2 Tax=unclassified Burkholderia TaxID=2613784 RepID=UPI001FC7DB8E|nr:fimbria/pilus periplasmic chaperone [Burkholderia sp. BCC0801]